MIYSYISTTHHSVNHPGTVSFPNNYRLPIHWDERTLGGKYTEVRIEKGENICIYPGSWNEPPIYEPDPFEIIYVRSQMRYWGKGIK